MGIDISTNKEVLYNSTHNRLVDTRIRSNIQWAPVNTVPLASLLIRQRTADKIDGNPLIYSLKNINDYTINIKNLRPILKNASKNLDDILMNTNYDLVIATPSSSKISYYLAKTIYKKKKARIISKYVLRKKRNVEVIKAVKSLKSIKDKHKKLVHYEIKNISKNQKANFSLKNVNGAIRKYFCPIDLFKPDILVNIENILIVDDTVSSGTTLYFAQKLIKSVNPNVNIQAISLLGSIH